MHLLPDAIRVTHSGYIGGDNGGDTRILSGIYNLPHQRKILTINNRINREITLDTMFAANSDDLTQILRREIIRRARTHIQSFDTEINGVGPSLYSRHQRFIGTDRRHYFKILLFQGYIF